MARGTLNAPRQVDLQRSGAVLDGNGIVCHVIFTDGGTWPNALVYRYVDFPGPYQSAAAFAQAILDRVLTDIGASLA